MQSLLISADSLAGTSIDAADRLTLLNWHVRGGHARQLQVHLVQGTPARAYRAARGKGARVLLSLGDRRHKPHNARVSGLPRSPLVIEITGMALWVNLWIRGRTPPLVLESWLTAWGETAWGDDPDGHSLSNADRSCH